MSEIFKLCYLKNNIIEKIDVYSGDGKQSQYKEQEDSIIAEIESNGNIQVSSTPTVTFLDTKIYLDEITCP